MPERKLWNRRFVFLLLTQAGFGFAHSAFMMLPKWMATELDAGPDAIGRVVAVSAMGIVLFLMPAGAMVDRYGRKRFLAAGAALMSVTSLCYVNVESIGVTLYLLRILQSIAFAYAFAGGAALCVDAAPPERIGQAVGLFGLSYVVMGAFAPAAVEEIVAASSWDTAFALAAGAAAWCALGGLLVHEEPLAAEASEPVALGEILVRREMLWGISIVALLGMAFGCAMNFHQPYALDLGLTRLRDFFIANSVAATACRLLLGPFMDRIGLRRVAVASLTAYSAVMLSLVWLDRIGLAPIGFGMGLAHGLFYPAYTGSLLAGCPANERGRRMSIIQAGLNGGMGAGGIALGWLAARAGYPIIFVISAGAVLFGAFLITRTLPASVAIEAKPLSPETEAA
ncbi:MAG: MFS transporter [bacterium]|nr:MFS transporter [bacterium]